MMIVLKRRKINSWHKLIFYMIDSIIERVHKFIKILFIKEYLVFFVRKAFVVLIEPLFALRNRHIKVICPGRFNIKKISALPCLHFLRVNFVPAIVFVLFHSSIGLLGVFKVFRRYYLIFFLQTVGNKRVHVSFTFLKKGLFYHFYNHDADKF